VLLPLDQATRENAGGKAAVLGELVRAGFPVPHGFVVPVEVYRAVTGGLGLPAVLAERGAAAVRRLLEETRLPSELVAELSEAVRRLGGRVAVRSSGSAEDRADASAAGQYDSFLGVGEAAVADRVVATWASLWSDRALAYRTGDAEMAVVVQQHVDADVAGVLFTGSTTLIEASWGLGESVVRGSVTPDAYTVGPAGVVDRRLGTKPTRVDRADAETITTAVPAEASRQLCLDDRHLTRLAQLGQQVAAHLGAPQDIEFALQNNHLWLLQSRPITSRLTASRHQPEPGMPGLPIGADQQSSGLRGIAGSPGVVAGPACVVRGAEDFQRVRRGDILVCRFTDPAWTPLFGVVGGVVTEVGGMLSHAAIVARERRIPAVLGVPEVMGLIADGELVRIDGGAGTVSRLEAGRL
jgi:pyruvate,water dikinase